MRNFSKYITHTGFLLLTLFCCGLLNAQTVVYLSRGSQVTINVGTLVTIAGDVIIDTSAELTHNGMLAVGGDSDITWSDPNVAGGLNGTGQVIFQGKGAVHYSGFTRFYDLTLDGGPVDFMGHDTLGVINRLLLKKGVINTGSGSAVYVLNPAFNAISPHVSNEGYSKSYINGSLVRNISVNTLTYDFPVGDQNNIHLLSFMNRSLSGVSSLAASFNAKQGTDAGIQSKKVSYCTSVNDGGVWKLQPEGSYTGGSYGVQLSLNGFKNLVDDQFIILARPLRSSSGQDWMIPAESSIPRAGSSGRTLASGYTVRDNMTSFFQMQFGIGMSSILLHSTLAGLNAKRVNADMVNMEWNTLPESGNHSFNVERRTDNAISFTDATPVQTKAIDGSSATSLNYSFSDHNSYGGTTYYRLRQISKDGIVTWSNTVTVSGSKPLIKLSPNPTSGIVNISLPGSQEYILIVSDGQGRKVMQQKLFETSQIQLNKLASGTYTITLYNAVNLPVLTERVMLIK